MKIKKYVANDFQEAIQQAKKELGQDAIILHTRYIKKRGLLGFFLRPRVEITAALDDNLQVDLDRLRKPVPAIIPKKTLEIITPPDPPVAGSDPKEAELVQEIKKMKDIMGDIKIKMLEVESIKGISEKVQSFYNILINSNVDQEIALKLARSVENRLPDEKCADDNWVQKVCVHTLQEYLHEVQPVKIDPDKKGRVVVLVGPTGVGKTTTIAKLAANMTFMEGQEVALITLDTYRISAAEQLKTYAEIIGVPIRVVFNPSDLGIAIQEFKDKDVIFVDTAGRSPFNSEHMEELNQFINMAHPDETILVLSVTTATKESVNIYDKFNFVKIDKLIFTKLDETEHYGQILNTIYEIKKPVAYFTTGQNVPDDIEVPEPLSFARMLLGRDEAL